MHLPFRLHRAAQTLLLLVVPLFTAQAQQQLTHVLGAEYEAGWLRTAILGEHWRDAWTTPVTVPVLDLGLFAGGLTPVREGGGVQSRTLYLRAAGGREFKFRAINVDPSMTFRSSATNSIITKAMLDQITSILPFAPVVAAHLERRVGLLTSQPVIMAIPDSPLLGAYRDRYAGLVGTIERHPDESLEDGYYYAGSERIVDTHAFLTELERGEGQQVDATAFCKARLMDLLLGDWDRRAEQWRWALFRVKGQALWHPIPRDRDQAFSLYDGLIPSVVERLVRPLQGYEHAEGDIVHLVWAGRHLDRRLLSRLERRTWDSLAVFIQSSLTDAVIDSAVHALPHEWHARIGSRLANLIRQRRDALPGLTGEFYHLLADVVDVYGTTGDDRVDVRRHQDGAVSVRVTGAGNEEVFFRRFLPGDTDEIRIHALAGNDSVLLRGTCTESIDVRVIGGSGNDALIDSSIVEGYLFYITPVHRAEFVTRFYDDDAATTVVLGPGSTFDGRETLPPSEGSNRFEPDVEDRGGRLLPAPRLSYNSDDGFILGTGPVYTRYGFRAEPYAWRMKMTAAYATATGNIQLEFDGEYQSIFPGVSLMLSMYHTELSLGRYYGPGNESTRDADLEADDYYGVEQERVDIRPMLRYDATAALRFDMGAAYRYSETSAAPDSYLGQNPLYGLGSFKYAEIFGVVSYDTRDNHRLPLRGVYAQLSGSYFPVLRSNKYQFADGRIDLRAYWPLLPSLTLAVRAMGQNIWGRYPFYHAAYLGGKSTIRGYSRERFAGESALLGSAELRATAGAVRLFFPGTWGALAFFDAGRVYADGEESRSIHSSFGGGLWLGLIDKRLAVSVQAGLSDERLALYVKSGFTF